MRTLILALVFLLPIAAHAQSNGAPNPIVARSTALVEAINAQDLAAIGSLYTENAVLLIPGQDFILGRANIVAYYENAFARNHMTNLASNTSDISVADTLAVEIGEWLYFAGDIRIVTRFMHMWEVVDNEILLSRDMFHVLSTD